MEVTEEELVEEAEETVSGEAGVDAAEVPDVDPVDVDPVRPDPAEEDPVVEVSAAPLVEEAAVAEFVLVVSETGVSVALVPAEIELATDEAVAAVVEDEFDAAVLLVDSVSWECSPTDTDELLSSVRAGNAITQKVPNASTTEQADMTIRNRFLLVFFFAYS